jgi:hypothetical protein
VVTDSPAADAVAAAASVRAPASASVVSRTRKRCLRLLELIG